MNDTPQDSRPPLGSWPATYALACFLATLTIVLLAWLTAAFDKGPIR